MSDDAPPGYGLDDTFGNHFRDKNGDVVTLRQWATLFEDTEYQQIIHTHVGGVLVSTVWLGIDMARGGTPQIFETMIFGLAGLDDTAWRYATEAEALRGHHRAVDLVRRRWHKQYSRTKRRPNARTRKTHR